MAAQIANYRVTVNPYRNMAGPGASRALVQHHDHLGASNNAIVTAKLGAWDDAGFSLIPLHHYSGGDTASAWSERKWPFPISGFDAGPGTHETEQSLFDWLAANYSGNIKAFFPSAEEVGVDSHHILSPFLDVYIESPDGSGGVIAAEQYATAQEAIDQIGAKGDKGVPFIAHPNQGIATYGTLKNFRGVEMYSGFGRWAVLERDPTLGSEWSEASFLARWDDLLSNFNPNLLGIAVNDWLGPGTTETGATDETTNSGKVEARLSLSALPDFIRREYKNRLREGAIFSIKDLRADKSVATGWVEITGVAIASVVGGGGLKYDLITLNGIGAETVTWKGNNGVTLGTGKSFKLNDIHYPTRYARAEIVDGDVTIYTQPFILEPLGF